WLDLGSGLKVGFYGHFTPGDDDVTSATGDLGTQPDNKLTRFTSLKRNGSCRLTGPQLFTRRRYNSVASGLAAESQCLNGDGGAKLNGAQVYELLFQYKAAKNITISGNYSLIRSAAARSNIDANGDGDALDAGDSTFSDSKNVGNEFDIAVRWDIYKGLRTIISYAHLFAGDYGKSTTATRDFDDTWMLVWELTHAF
ncbi:MAG: alginate export family protein, partial [Nitrospinota bacterium]